MSKKRKILLVANLVAVSTMSALLIYLWSGDILLKEDNRRAVEQCTAEVEGGCPLLFQYASELERQNARLNLRVRECSVLVPDQQPPTDTGR